MGERDTPPAEPASLPIGPASPGQHDGSPRREVQFEELVTELLAVAPERVHNAIQAVMGGLLDLLALEHCAIFLPSGDGRHLEVTDNQARAGMPPASEVLPVTDAWTMARVRDGKRVY